MPQPTIGRQFPANARPACQRPRRGRGTPAPWRLAPAFAIAVLLFAPGLSAQPAPPSLDRLDQDGDGLVSREEFLADDRGPGLRMLARVDADGDGAVTREELQAAIDRAAQDKRARAERHLERRFEQLDEDGDGMIMRAEVLEQAFDRLDSDGDGYISEAEAQAARDRRDERRGRREGGPGNRS